jgi:hypothetical protein
MPPRRPPVVVKLSDHFGQYVLLLTCAACGHHRKADPEVLAKIAGREAALADVLKRLRCSKCGVHGCMAKVLPATKRDR